MKKNYKFSYKPLLKLLKDRKISMNSLKEKYDISSAMINRISHDKPTNLDTLIWLMEIIGVLDLSNVIEFHVKDGDYEDQI